MKAIHVLGDLNIDLVFTGMRREPRPGSEVQAAGCAWKAGGSAANTALVLRLLGAPVRLFSQVGSDRWGQWLREELAAAGLDPATVTLAPGGTSGVTVLLNTPRERSYISHPGNLPALRRQDLAPGYLQAGQHLHLASFFILKALRPEVAGLLREARDLGMSTSLDPGSDPADVWETDGLLAALPYVDWFLPNADELRAILRTADLEEAFRRWPAGLGSMAVKNGEAGTIVRHGGRVRAYPAERVEAVDASCTGDSFNAGFLAALSRGASVPEAVRLGSRCGALAAASVGLPGPEAVAALARQPARRGA